MKIKISKKIVPRLVVFLLIFNLLSTSFLPYFQTPFHPNQAMAAGNSCSMPPSYSSYTSQVGGVSLDQAATFLANMDDVTGAYYDENLDRIVFVGKKNTTLPEFDKDDLAVAIRAVIFNKVLPAVSIEPDPNNPNGSMNTVIYRGGIEDTKFGQVLVDADYKMKKYEFGYDENQQVVTSSVPGYKSLLDRYIEKNPDPSASGSARFVITPKLVSLKKDDAADSFIFDQVSMEVYTEPLSPYNDPKYNEAAEEFAQHHTDNYDLFAQETPSYAEAKQLGKIVAVVKWISDTGIATDFHWAADYAPKKIVTPKQLPKIVTPQVQGWIMSGGAEYYTPNTYSPDSTASAALKSASESVNAPKEDIHWTFTKDGQQYESVAVAADAFRSLGSYNTAVTDMSFPTIGDVPLEFTRSYSSFSGGQNGIGRGWSFMPATVVDNLPVAGGAYKVSCDSSPYVHRYKLAFMPNDGQRETFTYDCDINGGSFVPDENVFHSVMTDTNPDSSNVFVTVTLKDQTQYVFQDIYNDPTDTTIYKLKLYQVKDKNGNKINYNYESSTSAKLTSISDDHNHTIALHYSSASANLISSIEDWTGREVLYTYDTQGNLLTVTDPEGHVTTYTYDDNYKLASITDGENQTVLTNTYTPEAKIATQSAVSSKVKTYTYDDDNRQITLTDNLGRSETTSYDEKARILEQEDPLSNTITYTYGTEYSPLTVTDKNGHTITNTYDSNGNLTSVTYPDNKVVTYEYNTKNEVTKITDGRYGATSKETTYTYNTNGDLTQINEAGKITNFTPDSYGQVAWFSDPLDHWTETGHDDFGNVTFKYDPLRKMTDYNYDSLGRLTEEVDPNGREVTYTYDDNGNVLTRTDGSGTTTYEYDADNRLKKTILPDTAAAQYSYNASSSLASVTDANSGVTSYGYDQYQNLTSKENALDKTTTYTYDDLNRRTQATTPLGKVARWEYDGNGNITKRIDENNQTTNYEYDALNRLTKITYPDTTTVVYTYDNRGNMLTMVSPVGTTTYSYDVYDRLTSVTDPNNETISYEYDDANNLKKITYPDSKEVSYTYDVNNRLSSITDWNSQQTTYSYNDNGTLAEKTLPNGITTDYSYDNANRIIDINNLQGTTSLARFTYQRDSLGNITSASESGVMFTSSNQAPVPLTPSEYTIYDDALASGWVDWSWNSTTDFSDTTQPYKGSDALTWTVNTGYGGLHLAEPNSIDTTGYRQLSIALRATQPGQQVQVQLYDASRNPIGAPVQLENYGGDPVPDYYKVYNIPLKDLSGSNRLVSGIVVQDLSGSAQPKMYIDEVKLTNIPSRYMVYDESLTTGWVDWSWNSTTNFANIVRPYWGLKDLTWTLNVGYGGLHLAQPNDINTSGYDELVFDLQATQLGQQARVQLYDSNRVPIGNAVDLADYGGYPIPGKYKEYRIPLADLNGSNTMVSGIVIQDLSGSSQPFMYVDAVRLEDSLLDNNIITGVSAEYWNSGTGSKPTMPSTAATLTRTDSRVDFDWGAGSPDPLINDDHFIARWTDTAYFDAGDYKFFATADDGVRVYLDNQLVIDSWKDQPATIHTTSYQSLTAGNHTVVMEYYEDTGSAKAKLSYRRYSASTPQNVDFTYDNLQRLTSAIYKQSGKPTHEAFYTYDKVGNRLTDLVNKIGSTYTYNDDNELTKKGPVSFTYDNNGNQISSTSYGTTKTLDYDLENRLTELTDPISSTSVQFTYDGKGDRLGEKVNSTPVKQYVNDVSGDLTRVLEAKDVVNNTSDYYIYGTGLLSDGGSATADRQYYLEDGLGNIRFVMDSSGDQIEEYQYDPDGNEMISGPTSDFRYKGEQLDADTGLYFMRARYYDPATGRFISHDPIEGDIMLPQSQNGYDYANNNPINLSY